MRFIVLSSLLLTSFLSATSYLLRDDISQEVTCSDRGLTKVSLDEGEFVSVIIQDSTVEYHLINNGAQLIINGIDDDTPVILVTSSGDTASIILTPTPSLLENHLIGFAERDSIPLTMQRILANETPKGFKKEPLSQTYEKHGIKIQNKSTFQDAKVKIILFTMQNVSEEPIEIHNIHFPSASHATCNEDVLNPGESCNAVAII